MANLTEVFEDPNAQADNGAELSVWKKLGLVQLTKEQVIEAINQKPVSDKVRQLLGRDYFPDIEDLRLTEEQAKSISFKEETTEDILEAEELSEILMEVDAEEAGELDHNELKDGIALLSGLIFPGLFDEEPAE
jgi:hypothetical protein